MSWWSLLFLGLVPLGLFAAGVVGTLREIRRLHRVRTWPRVQGSVENLLAVEWSDAEGGVYYRIELAYWYSPGVLPRPGKATLARTALGFEVKRFEQEYPVGMAITIAYDPANPDHSELADASSRRLRLVPVLLLSLSSAVLAWLLAQFLQNSR